MALERLQHYLARKDAACRAVSKRVSRMSSALWACKRRADRKALRALRIASPLRGSTVKQALPWRVQEQAEEEPDGWQGHCPCCKRPLTIEFAHPWSDFKPQPAAKGFFAYVITLWGSSSEYVLGALVLGHSIRKTGSPHARVCLFTDDVPDAFVALLSQVWECRRVAHINFVEQLGKYSPEHRFARVFTKLRALELVDFEKILMLDIDTLVRRNIDELFELKPPAAMRRGASGQFKTGDSLDGSAFFMGQDDSTWSWGQGTGINAGVMLLQPNQWVFNDMQAELSEPNHPEHCVGNGPEQDYVSRYWADSPWKHIGVEYNFQIHHMFLCLHPDKVGRSQRVALLKAADQVKVIHFSGDDKAKPWRRILDQRLNLWPDRSKDENFLEIFMEQFQGYWLWVKRDKEWLSDAQGSDRAWEFSDFFLDGGNMYRREKDGSASCVNLDDEVASSVKCFMLSVLSEWFDALIDLQALLNVDLQQEMGRLSRLERPPEAGLAPLSLFRWKRQGEWWIEELPAQCFKATVLCQAGTKSVTFLEDQTATLQVVGQPAGLFIKAVGGSSCHLELGAGQLQSFKEWLERERGAPFLLAMVGSASEPPLPEAMALLELPSPPQWCSAFAAAGTIGSWHGLHAASDAAYVSVQMVWHG